MLSGLKLEETNHRLNEIQKQYKSTFEWLFENELAFIPRLTDFDGCGLYWITGSGMSTIMKLARQNPRSLKFLLQNAGGNFFFPFVNKTQTQMIQTKLGRWRTR